MKYKNFFASALWLLGFATAKGQITDSLTVHFASNESVMAPEEQGTIDRQFNFYKPGLLSIELVGYCDNVGGDKYNDSLSDQRVAAVRKYLQSRGMTDTLFKIIRSYGKRRPLNDNADEEKRSLNRRVTIVWQLDTAALMGKNLVLNILFIRDTHRLMAGSFPAMHDLLMVMRRHPGLKIEIQGYVCCTDDGYDGFDIETRAGDLSLQRAKTVYSYLEKFAIDTSRISYKGFGGSRKIFPNEASDWEKTRNRRVEIKVLHW